MSESTGGPSTPGPWTGGGYQRHYSEKKFQSKLAQHAARAGRKVVEKALVLYYCVRDPQTPAWARARIVAALGYFILPLDLAPDVLPLVGFADDLVALSLAFTTVALHVKPVHRERSRETLQRWFGKMNPGGSAGSEGAAV